jgi:hypothetical protein
MTCADTRHLRRMLSCITSLRGGSISLAAGADSLLFLRNALEHVDGDWDESFTAQIATLESAGVATDEQVATMGASYGAVISQALDRLEVLAKSRLPSDAALESEADE